MCRNIIKLRTPEGPPTEDEIRDASLQFVRKVSGYRKPSKANEPVFEQTIDEITKATQDMFAHLIVREWVVKEKGN
ncbi:MAG: DUF2277 domain-containing protein [Chloroflexi bacterium]|nr:MAG: DUF2277 domain-containing protein [Chloroflexota bacterium]MBL1195923.1 DUF2277 domain-containing protein [Chloroflexota bacterium]NOH13216.1 DUF2277 domain-containing protein [Chloroflexota bacterium]